MPFMINQEAREPLVSVIIPVYNGQNYLEEAIRSCIKQSYKNIEIVVVDDGSYDKTEGIVKELMSEDTRVIYFRKENGGVGSALNYGLEKIHGDYFTWLSHDDRYNVNKIKVQLREAQKYLDNTILHCNYSLIDENSKNINQINVLNNNFLGLEKNPLYALYQSSINGCCLFIPRSIFSREEFRFNENLLTTQDYDLWYRIFQKTNLVHLNQNLVDYRVHEKQDSRTSQNLIQESENLWSFFAKEIFEGTVWTGPQDPKIILSHLIGHLISTDFQRSIDFAAKLLIERIKLDISRESTQDYKIVNVINNHLKQRNINHLNNLGNYYERFSNLSKSDDEVNFLMMLLGGASVLVDSSCDACKYNKMISLSHNINYKSLFCKKIRIYICAMDQKLTHLDTSAIANFALHEVLYKKKLISVDCNCNNYADNLVLREMKSNSRIQQMIFSKVILSLDLNSMNYDVYKVLNRSIFKRYQLFLIARLALNWIRRKLSNL
jgi:glycosyltransferase involved in cell wall biosynthesis